MNENENENVERPDSGTLAVITGAEIDSQIATARRFPRHTTAQQVAKVRESIRSLATQSEQIASECFYAVPRDGKMTEGPSIRFAEIVVANWGNCRAGARVVAEERDHIIAQGVFHDLETNAAITREVKRRITKKDGRRFSADMIATTGNAACAVAMRNAVFGGVPRAYWNDILDDVRRASIGDAKTHASKRAAAMAYLQKMGATEAMVLGLLKRQSATDITGDDLTMLRGIANAIRDGETTVDAAFAPPEVAATTKQEGAPAQSEITESSGLGEQPKQEPEQPKAEPPKAKKQKAAKEPAPTKVEDVTPPKSDDEAALDAEAARQEAAEANAPREGESRIPLTDTTTLHFGFAWEEMVPPSGTLFLNGDVWRQWDATGKRWLRFADQAEAATFVHTALQKKLTQGFKRARMERAAALAHVKDVLGLDATPIKLGDLSLAQLIELVRVSEDPSKA